MDESLNPVMIDPRDIRNMSTWVFLKCVRENASGGMVTKGISNSVNWLTAGDTVYPGPARKYYIHPLHLVLLDSTAWRLILFEKYSTENELLESPHLGVSSNPPATCQASRVVLSTFKDGLTHVRSREMLHFHFPDPKEKLLILNSSSHDGGGNLRWNPGD